MLAESRSKQKWSCDPRNTTWAKDDSRFGVKMLEKMGWEKGKGLGANEDGKVNPVKVAYKSDNLGLGCSIAYDKNWVAHQDNFASLLSELNRNVTPDSPSAKEPAEAASVSNLEEKSKVQKRVHYKKFTKGKDLSTYKAADMAAIFGSGVSHSEPVTPQTLSEAEESNSSAESCPEVPCNSLKPKLKKKKRSHYTQESESGKTVKSQYSVQEYFKMRMEKISAEKLANKQNISIVVSGESPAGDVNNNITKKKKKRKKSQQIDIEESPVLNVENAMLQSVGNVDEMQSKRKKKRKVKNIKLDTNDNYLTSTKNDKQNGLKDTSDCPPKKKKKKDKNFIKDNIAEVNKTLVDVKA
ncbi:uncharacterized protein LOC143459398 [Clavelina lepadiformis]|uniref:uncharacterized protein LOC143459398 n=1 Tax=Clavelina lepadiformis TaxID=159417 RepID=UPI004041FEE4